MQTFFLFLILFILSGAYEDDDRLQGMWVEKYTITRSESGMENISSISSRKILYFFEDSVHIKKFPFDFISPDHYFKSGTYEQHGSKIILKGLGFSEAFNSHKLDNGLLVIETERGGRYIKMILQKLQKNGLASKHEEVLDFLTTNNLEITIGDKTGTIKFDKNGTIQASETLWKISDNNWWTVDQFNGELFVLTDGVLGFIMHVHSIGKDKIEGVVHSKEKRGITFIKTN